MHLPSWEDLSIYLFIEKKLDRSREQHLAGIYNIILDFFSDKTVDKQNINKLFLYLLKERRIQQSSCNVYLKLLKHATKCMGSDMLDDYSYFKCEPVHTEPLTYDEIRHLAEVVIPRSRESIMINHKFKVVIYTLALTGMRIQELCDLAHGDMVGNRFIIRDSKTNDTRQVPIPKFLIDLLETLPREGKYIFGTDRAKLSGQQVNRELKMRAELLGIKKRVYCHLFRHTVITQWIKDGHSIAKIARIVGHSDLETTNGYTHLIIDDLVEVVESHPLLKYNQTLDSISSKIRSLVDRVVDKTRFISSVTEDSETLIIKIEKSYTT